MEVYLLWELKKHEGGLCLGQTTITDSLILVGDSADICWAKVVEMMKMDFENHVEGECDVTIEPSPALPVFKPNEIPVHGEKFFDEIRKEKPAIKITKHFDRYTDEISEYWYWIETWRVSDRRVDFIKLFEDDNNMAVDKAVSI